jgi:hypothetical protein
MDGAPESDIALILAAIDSDGSSVERLSNNQMQLRLDVPQVAGLGTRLVTEGAGSEAQVTEKTGLKEVAERVGLLAAGDGRSSSASLRTAAAKPRRPKIALRFLSNPVGSSTRPAPPNKKGLKNRPFLFGGEGGIRTLRPIHENQQLTDSKRRLSPLQSPPLHRFSSRFTTSLLPKRLAPGYGRRRLRIISRRPSSGQAIWPYFSGHKEIDVARRRQQRLQRFLSHLTAKSPNCP